MALPISQPVHMILPAAINGANGPPMALALTRVPTFLAMPLPPPSLDINLENLLCGLMSKLLAGVVVVLPPI